jgi:hypothetical protein
MRKRRKTPSSTPVQINPAHLSIGDVLFPEEWLNQKARESGFIKRKSRKIHPRNLLASLVGSWRLPSTRQPPSSGA